MSVDTKTVLGFDFGSKRIGVAIGQTLTHSATALTQILYQANQPDWDAIKALIIEWRPHVLVVGLPLNMDETASPISAAARHFAKQLAARYQLPVELIDERLSSREAKSRLETDYGHKRHAKKAINSVAAQIIIESWLQQQSE